MDFEKTLKEIESELSKDNKGKNRGRLIIIRNTLKKIVLDEKEGLDERTSNNDVYQILIKKEIYGVNANKYIIEFIDMFHDLAYINIIDVAGFKIGRDDISSIDLNLFYKELKKEIPTIKISKAPPELDDVSFIIEFSS